VLFEAGSSGEGIRHRLLTSSTSTRYCDCPPASSTSRAWRLGDGARL